MVTAAHNQNANCGNANVSEKNAITRKDHIWDFLQNIPIALYEIDYASGKFINVNEIMSKLSGYSRDELLSKSATELLTPESKARFLERAKKALAGGKVEGSVEYDMFTKDGRKLSTILAVYPVEEDGAFVRALVAGYDITERKKAEEALKESKERLKFHYENLPLAVVECDSNFVVSRWAGEAETIFGWAACETVGRPIMDLNLIYEPDISLVRGIMRKLTDGVSKRVTLANRNITKDGRVIYCTWYHSVLYDSNGKMSSVMSMVEDNTARIIAETKLKEYSNNLERLVEERTKELKSKERLAAIGATAGMVGHDIRNPLQAITGDVYLLKDCLNSMPEVPMKGEVAESLESIEQNVSYINKIVADLQDYARPIIPQYSAVNLYELVVQSFQLIIIPPNVSPMIEIDRSLSFKVDPNFLQRILTNLIINALQAMPDGGKLIIQASDGNGKVSLVVEDTGVGIPEHVKAKLFTPMMTTKAKGQGLGLAVIKRLVEAMKGTITFESKEGRGTKFIIELPSNYKGL